MSIIEKKCIYCGKGASEGIKLNESHIIPDALTNYKGSLNKNNNVCSILHNSEFGRTFESEITNGLEQLRNILGIKNKEGRLPYYPARIKVNGMEYKKKMVRYGDFFDMQGICSGIKDENTYKIGKVHNLLKVAHGDHEKIKGLNLNKSDISIDLTPDLDMFSSEAMFRLTAKISFEWFCRKENINNKIDEMEAPIKFIETGGDINVVEIIDDMLFYEAIDSKTQPGSHLIGYYAGIDNVVYGLVSVFGLVIYKVRLCENHGYHKDDKTINLTEIRVDGSLNEFTMAIGTSTGRLPISIPSLKPKDVHIQAFILEVFQTYYHKVVSTQLVSLRGLYPTVREVENILEINDKYKVHDYLIGYQDKRLLVTTYILYKIATSAYDVSCSFADNIEQILRNGNTQTITMNINELAIYLKESFLEGLLLPEVGKGIKIFDDIYHTELNRKG